MPDQNSSSPAVKKQGLRPWWKRLSRTLNCGLDLLYPLRCAACVARLPQPVLTDFCATCEARLEPVVGPFCQICSEPFTGQITADFSCPNCANQTYAFDWAITAWQCSGPLREAVHRYKYGRNLHLRLALARKLHDTFADHRFPAGALARCRPGQPALAPDSPADGQPTPLPWLLVPVPLHSRRFRERRFNQSLELAATLAKLSGIPCRDLLQRTRYTTAQAALNRQQRLKNLAGAFSLKPKKTLPAHAGIFLVDDVFTTGSTAHECALALKKAGAGRIIILTVARG
jgi:ComF family protein